MHVEQSPQADPQMQFLHLLYAIKIGITSIVIIIIIIIIIISPAFFTSEYSHSIQSSRLSMCTPEYLCMCTLNFYLPIHTLPFITHSPTIQCQMKEKLQRFLVHNNLSMWILSCHLFCGFQFFVRHKFFQSFSFHSTC